MFVPQCIAVPQGRRVTLRFAAPDVIHGILVTGTNVNTMVVPGFVAQVHTEFTRKGDLLMPCHEYCGLGHSEMWATVQVMPEHEFKPDSDGRVSCAQR
jgi:cytochrome c oxidase subunit 2